MLDSDIRRWVVCERGNRWMQAVRRFAPRMTPAPLILEVVEAEPEKVANHLIPTLPCIVLWEVESASLLQVSQWLIKTAISAPHAVQLVADCGISVRERTVLCEFPVAVLIGQPEQLPRVHPLVEGHFASPLQGVD
jgi:hypothetical protein